MRAIAWGLKEIGLHPRRPEAPVAWVIVFVGPRGNTENACACGIGVAGGRLVGFDACSPSMMLEYHSDLFYDGIHGAETLSTILGEGCESVNPLDDELVERELPWLNLVRVVWKIYRAADS